VSEDPELSAISPRASAIRTLEHARRSICVFCGSSLGDNPEFITAAQALGVAMAREGLGLVFGGGSLGLMGVVARASINAGAHVVGIIPDFLCIKEKPATDLSELVITRSMHERKQIMFDRSNAFVALPGGLGTLDEIVEQMTWMQIGRHTKPIVFLNVAGYWDPILTMFDQMRARQFIRSGSQLAIDIAEDADEVIPHIKRSWQQRSPDRESEHQILPLAGTGGSDSAPLLRVGALPRAEGKAAH
jgi:uncharacterized protein (TIGR00730 family)